jgi:CheY-like chemotaxis protein
MSQIHGMSHFLVADADDVTRHILSNFLALEHYQVQEACNGRHVLKQLLSSPYPLTVLLDYQIPEIDGLQLLMLMTAEGSVPPGDRYILMAARDHSLPMSAQTLLQLYAIPLLRKPFDMRTLVAVL